jgi:hypothetical protein
MPRLSILMPWIPLPGSLANAGRILGSLGDNLFSGAQNTTQIKQETDHNYGEFKSTKSSC